MSTLRGNSFGDLNALKRLAQSKKDKNMKEAKVDIAPSKIFYQDEWSKGGIEWVEPKLDQTTNVPPNPVFMNYSPASYNELQKLWEEMQAPDIIEEKEPEVDLGEWGIDERSNTESND